MRNEGRKGRRKGGRKWKSLPATEVSLVCAPCLISVCVFMLYIFLGPQQRKKENRTRKLLLDYIRLVVLLFREALSFLFTKLD